MKVVVFCHSLISDWNHGNAHFLRGVCTELRARGHEVLTYEPLDSWSLQNLLRHVHPRGLTELRNELRRHYPLLEPRAYRAAELDLDEALEDADLVLVHEWNDPGLVRRLGEHRRSSAYRILFHDSHHRSISDPDALDRFPLEEYDGVLAFGEPVREVYQRRGWGRRVWVWHEAADVRVFHPSELEPEGDLVWIGNWGDEERTRELHAFLLGPIATLGLEAVIHGVRYPDDALDAVRHAGAHFRGWIANYLVPEVLARFRATVHIPRAPYVEHLRAVPTIRPFEALACGIPLVSARWDDPGGLFRAGTDFLVARTPREMTQHLRALMNDADLRAALAADGLETVHGRHTCAHRVDELLQILAEIEGPELESALAHRPADRVQSAPSPALME